MRLRHYYVIVPAVALAVIMANAFYGHAVFSVGHPEDIAKFSVYVHFQPEWNSHPGNLLFEVTNVWNNPSKSEGEYYGDAAGPAGSDVYGPGDNRNRLMHAGERGFVVLMHRYSDCQINWQPVLYRYGIDTLRNQFKAMGGADISGHPYAVMYEDRPASGDTTKGRDLSGGYAQFIPVCSANKTTSYEYSVRSNDRGVAFDAYFVPDRSDYDLFLEDPGSVGYTIPHYAGEGCAVMRHTSFSGTCHGISGETGGLLIWVPDDLELALTKITVNLREL